MARAPHYRTLASLSRINLLRELQQRGPLTMTELTEATGLHQNTVREHLGRLERAGFIASDEGEPAGRGRPQLRYRTRLDAADLARAERLRALAGQVPATRRDAQASTPAGGNADEPDALELQLAALVDHLDECGIEADTSEVGGEADEPDGHDEAVGLHQCPYSGLASDNPQVCQAHFGLVREILRQTDGPLEAERLIPMVGPNRCTLHLRHRA